jgi:hypothetical protein
MHRLRNTQKYTHLAIRGYNRRSQHCASEGVEMEVRKRARLTVSFLLQFKVAIWIRERSTITLGPFILSIVVYLTDTNELVVLQTWRVKSGSRLAPIDPLLSRREARFYSCSVSLERIRHTKGHEYVLRAFAVVDE